MTSVLLVGTGQVGVRAARQLVDTPGLHRCWIASRDRARADELAGAMGDAAVALDWDPIGPVRIPAGLGAVAVAATAADAHRWVRAAAAAGVPTAVVADEGFGALDDATDAAAASLVTGCGLGPGLTDVLTRHAASTFDAVDEVHVARVGSAGAACAEAVREARRETPGEWRDVAWRTDRAFGPELLWFPDPVGARECQLVRTGVAATVATVPAVRHVTSRLGAAAGTGRFRRGLGRDPVDQGWGAARVEVSGWRAGVAGSVVYGVVDRTAVVAGIVLAVTAGALAGVVDAGITAPGGTRVLGQVAVPIPFLTELARRGVKAAAFEGVVPN